jgi:hypothetical protein
MPGRSVAQAQSSHIAAYNHSGTPTRLYRRACLHDQISRMAKTRSKGSPMSSAMTRPDSVRTRSESRQRTALVALRLLQNERDKLSEAAHSRGITLSEFIRSSAPQAVDTQLKSNTHGMDALGSQCTLIDRASGSPTNRSVPVPDPALRVPPRAAHPHRCEVTARRNQVRHCPRRRSVIAGRARSRSHADPRATVRYDRTGASLDRHATHIVAAFIAGAARPAPEWVS